MTGLPTAVAEPVRLLVALTILAILATRAALLRRLLPVAAGVATVAAAAVVITPT